MKNLILYIIPFILLHSCKKTDADFTYTPSTVQSIFLKSRYDMTYDSVIQLNKDTSIKDVDFSISGLTGKINISNLIANQEINVQGLPSSIREVAGIYTLLASQDNMIIDKAVLQIPAGEIHGKSTNYIGPKTTSFNDQQGALITGYFQDSLNNLVDTTLDLQYTLQIDQELNVQSVKTDHHYYFTHSVKPINNKRQLIGIKAEDKYSNEMTVLGSSGCPISAEMNISNRYNIADGRQVFTVELDQFYDEDRHSISNGTFVSLLFKSEDYSSTYNGQVVNGQARFSIQNPHVEGRYFLEARSCNARIATSKALYFKQSVQDINYSISGSLLKIGPILSVLNQTMPNGTPVVIQSQSCSIHTAMHLELEDGFASFDLSKLDRSCLSEGHSISINGMVKEFLIKENITQ